MSILSELKNYSPSSIIGMGISFIWTKLFFSGANLIRRPLYFRGKKKNLSFGDEFTTGRGCRIELFANGVINFGNHCHIGDYVHIVSSNKVEIGDDCLFASKIFISDTSHGSYSSNSNVKDRLLSAPNVPPNERPLAASFVKIGNNVWLGDNVVVLAGVTIGDGCIIGANATVTKDIPANSIAGGCPAKVLKVWDSESKSWVKA